MQQGQCGYKRLRNCQHRMSVEMEFLPKMNLSKRDDIHVLNMIILTKQMLPFPYSAL